MKAVSSVITRIEETILSLLLAGMVVVSFGQVISRYVFNSGWVPALELTTTLFSWLVLFGISYGVKMGSHLGVDAVIRLFPKPVFKALAIFGALMGVLYAVILLNADWLREWFGIETKGGAIAYWTKMYTIGIGLEDLRFPEPVMHALGFETDTIPRWVAYSILPIGLALLAFRFAEAAVHIALGKREMVIASHEAEELVAENKDILKD